jgi:hypothetical protein
MKNQNATSTNNQSTKVESKKVDLKSNVSKANEQIIALLVGEKINLNDLANATITDCITANAMLIKKEKHYFPTSVKGSKAEKQYRTKNRSVLSTFCKSVVKGEFKADKNLLSDFRKFVIIKYNVDLLKSDNTNFDFTSIYNNANFVNDAKVLVKHLQAK